MEMQFSRANATKRVSKSHGILQNFKTLSSNTPAPQLVRKSQLLRAPNDFAFLSKLKHRTDEDFRLMINLTIGRIYLYMLKMIELHRITDNYSVRYKLMNALVFKILDALNKIPRNIKGIFYSHSSFMTVIFKYQIEDVLSSEANSIFQVHNQEATMASPVRVSINVSTIEGLSQNKPRFQEVAKVTKSSYPFHVHLIQSFLKQISQKNQYQYLVSKLDLYKNSCELDQFDQDFQRVNKNKNKNKNKNQTQQKSRIYIQNSFIDSKQMIPAQKTTRSILNKTSFSRFSKAKSKQQVQNKTASRIQENNDEKNSIMRGSSYIIYFDNATKQYKNPFNKSKKQQNHLSSLASAARIIEKLNVYVLKRMNVVDSSSLITSFSENMMLTLVLLLCFGVGLAGILSFDNYLLRCGVLMVSVIGFFCSIVYSFKMDIDTQEMMRQDIHNKARSLFRNEPFQYSSEDGKYHIILTTPGEGKFQYQKAQVP